MHASLCKTGQAGRLMVILWLRVPVLARGHVIVSVKMAYSTIHNTHGHAHAHTENRQRQRERDRDRDIAIAVTNTA